jgi:hypothetical protein
MKIFLLGRAHIILMVHEASLPFKNQDCTSTIEKNLQMLLLSEFISNAKIKIWGCPLP